MNIQRLQYFISVSDHLNFTKAAEEFYMAQSAMSQQILKLENELGVKLFTRNNKNISLTTAGNIFIEDARVIVKKYDQALEKLHSAQLGYKGILNVAFNGQYERVFLPGLVKQLKKEQPSIELKIHSCPLNRISIELEQGITDVVFAFPYEVRNSNIFDIKTLFRDTISIAMNTLHPLAHKEDISSEDFNDETIIMVQEQDTPRNFERMRNDLSTYGIHAKHIKQVQDFDTMLLMVEAGAGIAFVPSSTKNNSSPNLVFHPIQINGDHFTHEVAAIYLRSKENDFIQFFITAALDYFKQFNGSMKNKY